MDTSKKIVAIRVVSMWESCERTTYYVQLETDEGFTITPQSFATGSIYTNFEGLTKDQARERALYHAHEWGDLLMMAVEPLIEDEVTYTSPDWDHRPYTIRRELARRREAKQ